MTDLQGQIQDALQKCSFNQTGELKGVKIGYLGTEPLEELIKQREQEAVKRFAEKVKDMLVDFGADLAVKNEINRLLDEQGGKE